MVIRGNTVDLSSSGVRQGREQTPLSDVPRAINIEGGYAIVAAVVNVQYATIGANQQPVWGAEASRHEFELVPGPRIVNPPGFADGIVVWSGIGEIDATIAVEGEIVRIL